ncbi:MAG TPA: CU044_5270 family protein [Gaiellaceae bacterium]|nr:CU044_5270 family protein [Gaiellaceae bacterium]
MNDQKLLETVRRADPVSADIEEAPNALLERLLASARTEPQSQRRSAVRHRRRPASRWAVTVGAATAAAIVAGAVMALLPAGDSGGPSPAAAAVLLHAARAAAKQPATAPPAPGQFVYTKSEGVFGNTTVPNGGQAFNTVQRYTRQQWIGPDGSGRILQVAGTPQLATSADRAAWAADGKPQLADGTGNIDATQRRGLYYLDLSNVPTDPAALKQLIEQRKLEDGPSGDAETFTIIGDLLRDSYAPPAVRSALYTVAAQLPGVQLIGATHDQLGRAGTAVGYPSHGNTQEFIIDPKTSGLLAEQTVDNTGKVVGWTAYLSSGIVDSTSAMVSTAP